MISLNEIRETIETEIDTITSTDNNILVIYGNTPSEGVNIVEDDDVILFVGIYYSKVVKGEIGETGVSRRLGFLNLEILGKQNLGTGRLLEVCDLLERGLHKKTLNHSSGESVFMEEASTRQGNLSADSKFRFMVNVPFWSWA
jgi:hypothetical protein